MDSARIHDKCQTLGCELTHILNSVTQILCYQPHQYGVGDVTPHLRQYLPFTDMPIITHNISTLKHTFGMHVLTKDVIDVIENYFLIKHRVSSVIG